MNIQPIVEGHGAIAAVPVLLRRLLGEAQSFGLGINAPIRRKRSELVQENELRRSIRLARIQPECGSILILFDGDRDCPKELGPRLQQFAETEASPLPCSVVLAEKEYEAWFLSAIESLRGVRGIRPDAVSHTDPERPRGAKEQVEARMLPGRSYSESADQAALTAKLDLQMTYQRCRSFRKLVGSFGTLATGMGITLTTWPPRPWCEAGATTG